jgi:hypothetical protein
MGSLHYEVGVKMELEEARKRLAILITIFHDCRSFKGVLSCMDCEYYDKSSWPIGVKCPYRSEHEEYWQILTKYPEILIGGIREVAKYLPKEVKMSMGIMVNEVK